MSFQTIRPSTDQLPKPMQPQKGLMAMVGAMLRMALAMAWKRPRAWWRSKQKVWVIERIHTEFGTKWYYDAHNPGPFTNYPHLAVLFRHAKATRFAEILKETYPSHRISVVDIETVNPYP
jgi:hypothetical protein